MCFGGPYFPHSFFFGHEIHVRLTLTGEADVVHMTTYGRKVRPKYFESYRQLST